VTAGWIFFSIVMPAIVAGVGWLAVLANERYVRKEREKEKAAKAAE
jgi:uncharacterized membrane protein